MNDNMLATALDSAWALLNEGARNRRSPVHTPALASIDAAGLPTQRVLVLRAAERDVAKLRFHTDARSPKLDQIGDGATVSVLAYHPDEKIQLRMTGLARFARIGDDVDVIWSSATPFARRCYLATTAPGTVIDTAGSGLPKWIEGREPTEHELLSARANFAVLTVELRQIDWLHLANSGHRRARFTREGDEWSGCWLVP